VAAVAEREQIAFAKCDAVTATGSKRRRRFGDFPARCFSDNLIFFMEKYSSGERADRRRRRMKEGERVAAVKIWRSEQRATNFGHRNRIEEATPIR